MRQTPYPQKVKMLVEQGYYYMALQELKRNKDLSYNSRRNLRYEICVRASSEFRDLAREVDNISLRAEMYFESLTWAKDADKLKHTVQSTDSIKTLKKLLRDSVVGISDKNSTFFYGYDSLKEASM
jgi:hypothetical protein